jgi:DNA repair exonuclease SbcCD ATPase subunit
MSEMKLNKQDPKAIAEKLIVDWEKSIPDFLRLSSLIALKHHFTAALVAYGEEKERELTNQLQGANQELEDISNILGEADADDHISLKDCVKQLVTERDQLRAENERLRAERDEVQRYYDATAKISNAKETIIVEVVDDAQKLRTRIAELKKALEPLLASYHAAIRRSEYSKPAADWFKAMPGHWPFTLETSMDNCRAALAALKAERKDV